MSGGLTARPADPSKRWRVLAGSLLVALVALIAPPAGAQTWEEIPPDSGAAPQRVWAGSAYDPTSNRLILFGGEDALCLGFCPATSDVFVLTNANGVGGLRDWIQLAPTGGPPGERFAPMVGYDSVSNRLIISGGVGPAGFLTDTWVLTNANGLGGTPEWIQIELGDAPARFWSGSAYDPASNRLIVFGGEEALCFGFCPATSDVFVLSNANGLGGPATWTELTPVGGPPGERYAPMTGYDSASNRLIVSGGIGPNQGDGILTDTWVLTNANGLGGTPEWIQIEGSGEPSRFWSGSAYDPTSNSLLVFGGEGPGPDLFCLGFCPATSDVFALSNANGLGDPPSWTQLAPSGGPPPERFSAVVEHDSQENRLIVFGGVGPGGFLADTWVLILGAEEPPEPPEPPEPTNQPPTAEAGPLQIVQCTSVESTEVTLDGSGSTDPDGDALTYTWTGPFPEGSGTVSGVNPTVTLPLGFSAITLVVNDGELDSEPDNVPIAVFHRVEGLLAPLASLGPQGQPVNFPDRAFKQGRTLPLRLRLFCGTTPLTDADVSPPEIVSLVRTADAIDLETVDLDAGAANDSGVLFRFSDDNWVYNLSTAGLSTGTYVISIRMPDGFNRRTGFVLK